MLHMWLSHGMKHSLYFFGHHYQVERICVISVCHTKARLLIDGVVPPVDVVSLGFGPMYILLVANREEVVVKYL